MTTQSSKINYGIVIGSTGALVTKTNYAVVEGTPDDLVVTKINYGIVLDTTTPEPSGRRRAIMGYRR